MKNRLVCKTKDNSTKNRWKWKEVIKKYFLKLKFQLLKPFYQKLKVHLREQLKTQVMHALKSGALTGRSPRPCQLYDSGLVRKWNTFSFWESCSAAHCSFNCCSFFAASCSKVALAVFSSWINLFWFPIWFLFEIKSSCARESFSSVDL